MILSVPRWGVWSNQYPEKENDYCPEEWLPTAVHHSRKQNVEHVLAFSAKISGCPTLSRIDRGTFRVQSRLESVMIMDPIPHEGYYLPSRNRVFQGDSYCDSLRGTQDIPICGPSHRKELTYRGKGYGYTNHEIYHLPWVCSWYFA